MNKTWLNSYPPGVPAEIDADAYSSVTEMVEQSLRKFADRPAFANFERVLTYSDVDRLSTHIAAFLQNRLEIQRGDRIAIMAPNILQYPLALYGIMRAGGITVNVNPMYTPRELQHQLNDAGASTIFVFEGSTSALEEVIGETNIENVVVLRLRDLLGDQYPAVDLGDSFSNPIEFTDLLEAGENLPFDPVELGADDTLLLQYTGGTTGLSKGATLTHRNLVANMMQFAACLGDTLRPGKEVAMTALPMYHIFALMVNTLTITHYGGLSVLITNPRDIGSIVSSFERWGVTIMVGVNTLYNGLLNTGGIKDVAFQLRMSVGGGAAVQEAVATQWAELTGTPILEGYGLSETSPILTMNKVDLECFSGSIGLPVPSTEISLRDDDGHEVPAGQPGELCAKGPQVMKGYWNQEQATAEVTTPDGFFRTGDIGTVDEDGFFRIVDRKKDMIIVSGFNVFPNEIEDVIARCAGVLECACIGVPDPKTGEAARVYVVRKPDNDIDESGIVGHCREHLTAYKVPRQVKFVDELPKSNVGKILRKDLREIAMREFQ